MCCVGEGCVGSCAHLHFLLSDDWWWQAFINDPGTELHSKTKDWVTSNLGADGKRILDRASYPVIIHRCKIPL